MMDLAVRQVLEASLNNAAVARRLGITRERVRQLREEARMPSVRQARYARIAGMLREGHSPREIAKALGVRSVRGSLALMRERGLVDDQPEQERAGREEE